MFGTAAAPEGITNPPIDALLERVESKYSLVIFGAKRARQINAYYSQLGEGLLEYVGPLVETHVHEKPLSIALREVAQDLLVLEKVDPDAVALPGAPLSEAIAPVPEEYAAVAQIDPEASTEV